MKPVLLEDIAEMRFGSNVQFSKDGQFVSYVITSPSLKKNNYEQDLFLYDRKQKKTRQLTFSKDNGSYIWDDAETLLIQTKHSEDDKPKPLFEKTSFYRLNIHGGEARPAFSIDATVLAYKKVKDGLYVIQALVDWNKPDPKKVSKEVCEEEKDYHILEEVPFWGNGRGFISGKRCALFLYDEKKGSLLRITEKYTEVSDFDVDEEKVVYVSRNYKDLIPIKSALTAYYFKNKKKVTIHNQKEYRIDAVVLNKENVIYTASTLEPYGNNQLSKIYSYSLKTKKDTLLFDNKEELGLLDMPVSDSFFGGSSGMVWDKDALYFMAMKGYHNHIYALKQKKAKPLFEFKGALNGFALWNGCAAFVAEKPNALNALYLVEDKKVKVVDDFNGSYHKTHAISKVEHFTFQNRNGNTLDGWILKPVGFQAKKKYPGLLEIHGGPRAAYGDGFFHEMQTFAAKGYVVFYTNPRGSEGYGEEFADLRGKYGTIDYEDLMDFVDVVLKKVPQMNPKKITCAGGSYGGFMCNWIVGHTNRFAAIASQRSVSNWVADFGASEIGVTFDSNEMGATPWSDMQKMWDQSPLKYACNAKTPILFIHSLCDYNCPLDQGLEMFTAMKYFHVPSRMVLFEGENHNLSRTGKPKHRIRRLKEMHDWFDHYTK